MMSVFIEHGTTSLNYVWLGNNIFSIHESIISRCLSTLTVSKSQGQEEASCTRRKSELFRHSATCKVCELSK